MIKRELIWRISWCFHALG